MNVKGIGQIVASEGVDGPGVRAVVHFAGCTVGCAGCFNPHTHSSTGDGTWERDACDLAEDLLAVSPAVTISGGEPTDQPAALLTLLRALRARGCDDIVLYTGRTREWLLAGANPVLSPSTWARRHAQMMLWLSFEDERLVDVVIDGPFIKAKLESDGGLTRGSTNQRVLCLTQKWTQDDFYSRETQVEIDEEGNLIVTGFPSSELQVTLRELAG
ncbi:NrdG Organic radical activating enzymes [uncultured Caudovirales phage]|uniref:NrdG Organic radical activating enzymes n=1 Tax=uncultured Caudovirales phage TaxID=2100421 RepID=A0A6J5S5D9_9CAUD|nr:NrdG Organic radical activating enzymes [uncultured Caudovirales phage]